MMYKSPMFATMSTTPQIYTGQIYTGTDDFSKLLLESDVWVDKSLFIKEFLENGDEAILITRPRRWGKSINMNMLKRFLAIEVDKKGQPLPKEQCVNHKLFVGGEGIRESGEKKQLKPLKIAEHKRLIDIYQGKYPVISLGLKNVQGNSYEEVEAGLRENIFKLYDEHSYLQNHPLLTKNQRKKLARFLEGEPTIIDLRGSLAFLSELLYKHFQKPVYVFVDEYDAPINHAYTAFKDQSEGELRRVLELFSTLFGTAFKTNPYLNRGLITGILRIAKANIFSDLNNVREYTILDKRFAASYGFTQAEVEELLQKVPTATPAEQIKQWYNGYLYGGEVIYNPWSIMCCLSEQGKLAPYWIDSGNTSLIDSTLIDDNVQADLQRLVTGETIESPIITQISFDDLRKPSGLFSLLLFSGYLNPVQKLGDARNPVYELSIPNHEVQYIYELRLLDWVSKQLDIDPDRYFSFVRQLAKGHLEAFEEALQEYLHSTTSFYQTGRKTSELFYNGFMLCLINTLRTYYHIHSEQEGIKGRSDALLIPKPHHGSEALVLEYKVTQDAEKLEAVAQAGVAQILQKGYAHPAKQHEHVKSALAICLAFSGKEVALAQKVSFTR